MYPKFTLSAEDNQETCSHRLNSDCQEFVEGCSNQRQITNLFLILVQSLQVKGIAPSLPLRLRNTTQLLYVGHDVHIGEDGFY